MTSRSSAKRSERQENLDGPHRNTSPSFLYVRGSRAVTGVSMPHTGSTQGDTIQTDSLDDTCSTFRSIAEVVERSDNSGSSSTSFLDSSKYLVLARSRTQDTKSTQGETTSNVSWSDDFPIPWTSSTFQKPIPDDDWVGFPSVSENLEEFGEEVMVVPSPILGSHHDHNKRMDETQNVAAFNFMSPREAIKEVARNHVEYQGNMNNDIPGSSGLRVRYDPGVHLSHNKRTQKQQHHELVISPRHDIDLRMPLPMWETSRQSRQRNSNLQRERSQKRIDLLLDMLEKERQLQRRLDDDEDDEHLALSVLLRKSRIHDAKETVMVTSPLNARTGVTGKKGSVQRSKKTNTSNNVSLTTVQEMRSSLHGRQQEWCNPLTFLDSGPRCPIISLVDGHDRVRVPVSPADSSDFSLPPPSLASNYLSPLSQTRSMNVFCDSSSPTSWEEESKGISSCQSEQYVNNEIDLVNEGFEWLGRS